MPDVVFVIQTAKYIKLTLSILSNNAMKNYRFRYNDNYYYQHCCFYKLWCYFYKIKTLTIKQTPFSRSYRSL